MPLFHRNTISFMGMNKRQDYLAARVFNDRIITLNNENKIITWDIFTGKIRMEWSSI